MLRVEPCLLMYAEGKNFFGMISDRTNHLPPHHNVAALLVGAARGAGGGGSSGPNAVT